MPGIDPFGQHLTALSSYQLAGGTPPYSCCSCRRAGADLRAEMGTSARPDLNPAFLNRQRERAALDGLLRGADGNQGAPDRADRRPEHVQYGYIGALVALTLALDDVEFLGAEADQSA